MSYSLYLIHPTPGKDPVKSAKAIVRKVNRPQTAALVARKQRLVQALLAYNPHLKVLQASTDEQAKINSNITLYDPDPTSVAIIITLADSAVHLEIHSGDHPIDDVLKEIRAYIDILQREEGYAVFDPQTDEMIDPDTLRPELLLLS